MSSLERVTLPDDASHIKLSVCHKSYVYVKDDKNHCWHCKRVCKVVKEPCNVPPKGWTCRRTKGHTGPCAATPTSENITIIEGMK